MGIGRRETIVHACPTKEAGESSSEQGTSHAARMGSSNSKEKELNEDLERILKERIAKERAERERVANLKLILVKVTSPLPGREIEIDEAVTVLVFLEKV